jgi:hypothetical protein
MFPPMFPPMFPLERLEPVPETPYCVEDAVKER